VVFAGQKVGVERPGVRTGPGEEVPLDRSARLQHDGRRQRAVREGIVAGLTSRNYRRAAMQRVLGERAEVQRCQIHKRRKVTEHWPKSAQGDRDRRIRNAYALTSYREVKAELEKIFRQLERSNPSAARSLEEGLQETLTVHRLGVATRLRQTLAWTNPIESCLCTVERVARNVKRWRVGDHTLRWTATGLREAEKKFRKVKGYRELEVLQRQLNPSLTQQVQVA